jgi:prolyl-tRNA editing enzyme YbaK/EbsC (Cys-tRNA(Pro) deacylase)
MPAISKQKREKISEQILAHLFDTSPGPKFTSQIAQEIARDEEFTKSLLLDLEKNKLIVKITKNSSGTKYLRRQRWRLSHTAFSAYKKLN